MAAPEGGQRIAINDAFTDDELRAVLARLEREVDRDAFGLVCKRWLHIQGSERRVLRARAGTAMLLRMADRFPGLVELDLSQSASRSFFPGVTDSDLGVIATGFRSLRVLVLRECKGVTDVGMISLGTGLHSLHCLNASGCRKVTDKGLVAVALGCSNLKSLYLANCKLVTDKLLEALSRNCHHLEELGLAGCVKITDSGLSILADGCKHIKSLDVSKCSKISDIGVSSVAEVCSSLRSLKLSDCGNVTDNSIISLAQSCINIETLVISGCHNVSDESIRSLALACGVNLKVLRMEWCLKITDLSVSSVLQSCRNLVALDIGCCDHITDSAFQALGISGASDLRVLKISNCPRITVSGIDTILQFCKSLEYLDVRSCQHITKQSCYQAGLQFSEGCKVNFNGSLSESDNLDEIYF
ncbi:putative leucine-rich repeat domain superfamily [Dioscorea sansibarensis]